MKAYNYDENKLTLKIKSGVVFDLQLRGNITLIRGDSGTGKTLLVKSIEGIIGSGANSVDYLGGVDVSNIITITKSLNGFNFEDDEKLVIMDRADFFLSDEVVERIRGCRKLRFLIFARGSYDFFISPNQIGVFVDNGNTVSIKYDFSKKGWF